MIQEVPKRNAVYDVRVGPREATEERRERAVADVAKILPRAVREENSGPRPAPTTP